MENKTEAELLKEQLIFEQKNCGELLSDKEIEAAFKFSEGYKAFLDSSKTEREAVKTAVELLKKAGYTEFSADKKYNPGDRVYSINRGKAIIAAAIGKKPLSEGVHIVASHIDAPRVDLKPRPMYEEAQLCYFKTHYYGGIKKYQWSAIPLSLHGIIVKADGETIEVAVGEDDSEPVFCINDLLPHLATEQAKRTMSDVLKGEELNVIIGCLPFRDDKVSEKVKLNIMKLLFDKYGIKEKDFISAELCLVPAFKARDIGFDRSMIGAYGHDDRVCAYPSLMAQIDTPKPEYTSVIVLADKEETGSDGTTGLSASYLKYFIANLAAPHGIEARTVLSNSKCLSADVNAAFDPNFADVYEKRNSAYINYGVVVTKYTGSRGKSGTNDAPAEMMGYVSSMFDRAGVIWQTGELGKVDAGGGGTVAKFIANLDVDTVDLGVPVLSMHAPLEVVSKIDVYETYKACEAFLK